MTNPHKPLTIRRRKPDLGLSGDPDRVRWKFGVAPTFNLTRWGVPPTCKVERWGVPPTCKVTRWISSLLLSNLRLSSIIK